MHYFNLMIIHDCRIIRTSNNTTCNVHPYNMFIHIRSEQDTRVKHADHGNSDSFSTAYFFMNTALHGTNGADNEILIKFAWKITIGAVDILAGQHIRVPSPLNCP